MFPDGAGSECTDADAGLSVSNYTVTLSPGQHSVTIETSAEARWSVVAAYVNRQVSPWAVNAHGETYGVENEQGTPDLVAVVATNGHGGYAYARDLESVHSRQPASPEEATRWQGSFVAVPVYESDGRTVVADESYIRESILTPSAKIVQGYQPIMPTFKDQVSEEEIVQLIRYIKELKPAGASAAPAAAVSGGGK